MYQCPKCQNQFEKGTKFCPQCGYHLVEEFIIDPICPVCKQTYPDGSKFCEVDGAKLVSADTLIHKCIICGKEYASDLTICPVDGGEIIAEFYKQVNVPLEHSEQDCSQSLSIRRRHQINTYFRLSAWLFGGGIFSFLMGWFGSLFGAEIADILAFFGTILYLIAFVFTVIIQFQAWKVVQAIQPRTSPGRAIGFLFIPLFNLYWVFVAFKGLSEEISNYATIKKISVSNNIKTLGMACSIFACIYLIIVYTLNMAWHIIWLGLLIEKVFAILMLGLVVVYFLFMKSVKDFFDALE